MVKAMFPSYIQCRRVRGYSTTKCTDPVVAPLMYPRWLATHHRWPQKDEFPLYFCKQLFAKFHLHYDVDYIDYPGHVGQGRGRLFERFRPPDTPAPVNKWEMVGPNLLVMPRGPQMVTAGERVPDASIRTQMFSSIAIVVTQLHDISSDRCSRNMLRSQGTTPTSASSSAPIHDDYGVTDIPSSVDIFAIVEVDALHRLRSCLSSDILDAYRAVSTLTGIPLRDMTSQIIRHILSRTAVPEDS